MRLCDLHGCGSTRAAHDAECRIPRASITGGRRRRSRLGRAGAAMLDSPFLGCSPAQGRHDPGLLRRTTAASGRPLLKEAVARRHRFSSSNREGIRGLGRAPAQSTRATALDRMLTRRASWHDVQRTSGRGSRSRALGEAVLGAIPRCRDQILRREPLRDLAQLLALAPAPAGPLVRAVLADHGRCVFDQRQRLEQVSPNRLRRIVFLTAVVGERGQGPG